MRLPPLTVATLVLAIAGPVAAADPIVATDLLRIRSVSSIDVARDGGRAVVAVRSVGSDSSVNALVSDLGEAAGGSTGARETPDEPDWSNESHLFLVDLASGAAPRQLTFGRRFDHDPAIAPDGRRVAFVRSARRDGDGEGDGEDDEDAATQVWVMPLDGGEARPVTQLSHGAGSPRWSPDGRLLLVTSRVPAAELNEPPPWTSERPLADRRGDAEPDRPAGAPDGSRAEIRAWLDRNGEAADPQVITRIEFQAEHGLRGPLAFRQLFAVGPEIAGGHATARQITRDFRDHDDAVFMPGGDRLAYVAKESSAVHPDRVLGTALRTIAIDGSDDRTLLALDGWSLSTPRPSGDGSVIAFAGRQMDQPAHRPRRLGIASIANGAASDPVWLTGTDSFDASVWSVEWLPSRSALVFNAPVRGGVSLMTMGLGLLEPAVLVDEENGLPVGAQEFGVGGGAIVYALTSAANPCVLRVRDARGERELWDLNPWIARKELSAPVGGWITRPDGTRVQYWLMEPTHRDPLETYPLVLEIHGGPSAMWGPGEFTMWHELQLLCSWGYAVVYANPRGSGGYGQAFRRANYQDWGEGPAGDVLAAVDQAMLAGWIDPERLVVTGGSYGGYLTAWIITQDHRFKAAVAQRGVYDLATFFGEGNAWRLMEWSMGGPPWEPRVRPILTRESPITGVNRIRTPLLIMHASNDLRTGVSQSEMLYRSLKRLGRPVEYVRYPNAGHDLSRTGDPRQRLDRLNRIIEFFERAIENPRPAPRSSAP